MRILTWNVGAYSVEQTEQLSNCISGLDPDIVCLQESATGETSLAVQVAKKLAMHCVEKPYAPSLSRTREYLALAILSKKPILNPQFAKLTNPHLRIERPEGEWLSHDKGLLEAETAGIRIVAGHALPFHRFKRDALDPEFSKIREEIENIISKTDAPTVFAGDLNFPDAPKLLPGLFNRGYLSAIKALTNPKYHQQTDFILVSKHWKALGGAALKEGNDHYPLYADLKLNSI